MNKIAIEKFEELERTLNIQYGTRIYTKGNKLVRLWKLIDKIYAVMTLGKIKTASAKFITTLGKDVYFPLGWSREHIGIHDYATLRHEGKHIKQNKKLSTLGMLFLYSFIPFPVGIAWFRYKFERDAYVEGWKAGAELGQLVDTEQYVSLLTGPDYFWAWPFKKSVRSYFKKECVLPEHSISNSDSDS